ncbi:hypothetical protein HaLaN_04489 [Haematococcus lacustris]|uniref:Uncharacterized protein n=1 Tax=Haematococcus lacustris TaxID=44745 RepID=A0A699YGT2_HAELA|nr:hypothetical protein HaLaN_04489 [Haematococcus lacustris]
MGISCCGLADGLLVRSGVYSSSMACLYKLVDPPSDMADGESGRTELGIAYATTAYYGVSSGISFLERGYQDCSHVSVKAAIQQCDGNE